MLFDFSHYKTDKGPKGHSYQRSYDSALNEKRIAAKNVLEIGSRRGSIRLWLDYFPNSTLYAWDLKHPWFWHDRLRYMKVNQSSEEQVLRALKLMGCTLDVVIDDGPHTPREQTMCFEVMFPYLSPNGVYIVEDLHCTDANNEPQKSYLKFMGGADFSFRQILSRLQSGNVEPTMFLRNPKGLLEQVQSIHVDTGDAIRFKKYQRTPSEIAFVVKK
ncbi:MAG: class I SAM-dependent methyltransferase [Pseudomonadota bacterium]